MKKVAIFDMDGTLLDSVPDIMESVNRMLDRFGYPRVDRARVIDAVGNGGEKFIRAMLPEGHEDEVSTVRPVYNEIYRTSGSPLTALFSGVSEALWRLKEAGVKLAVLSNKPHVNTCTIYEIKLGQFGFDVVLGNREEVPAKPDPAALYEIMEKLGARVEECVMVGDGENDMLVAKNCGMDSIAVSWGYRSAEILQAFGATFVANSPEEMTELILR